MLRVFPVFCIAALAIFFSSISDCSALTGDEWSRWQDVHSLYDAGKFDEAFQALSAQPSGDDPSYFYNLGTLAYRLGKNGAALGYLEKANRLKRHDPEIRHSLEIVRSDLEKTLGQDRLDPASNWMESLADQAAFEEIRAVLGLMALLLILFWIRTYWKNRDLKETLLRPAGLIGGTTVLLVFGLYGVETLARSHSPAIALTRQSVRSGPGETYVELSQIDAGSKVRLLGPSAKGSSANGAPTSDDWLQVRYSGDGVGWVRSTAFMVIN